jgi:hypothetical protein
MTQRTSFIKVANSNCMKSQEDTVRRVKVSEERNKICEETTKMNTCSATVDFSTNSFSCIAFQYFEQVFFLSPSRRGVYT